MTNKQAAHIFVPHSPFSIKDLTRGVCHIVASPFPLRKYFKAKEDLWRFKYFTMQKVYNLQ
jgi:hypothetical protein